jgi:hypothetical protein
MIDNKIEQLETRDAHIVIEGEFEVQHKEVAGIDFSTQALQELTIPQLLDTWSQLEESYICMKWKLAMLIFDKCKSKREFGQFLQEFRVDNPFHALCTINTSTFYRYRRAARFCERFEIYDLKECGISPTVIYELSEIKNETVVDDSFVGDIKNKNLPVSEIKRLICQVHSIRGEVIPELKESTESPEMDMPTQDFDNFEAINNETQTIFNVVEGQGGEIQPVKLTSQSMEIHVEPTEQLTKEAMAQEVLNMIQRFNLSCQGKINLLQVILEKVYEIGTGSVFSAKIIFHKRYVSKNNRKNGQ